MHKPKQPHYPLNSVKTAAGRSDGMIVTRKASVDAENLGHNTESIRSTLLTLKEADRTGEFVVETESGLRLYFDVYHPLICNANKQTDRIYLKIKMNSKGQLVVTVCSFHLD